MTRPLLTKAEVQDNADAARVAKYAKQKASKPKVNYVTSGGRHSDLDKLAWMRKQRCLVWENPFPKWPRSGCSARVEAHHHRVRGARANDLRTFPLCTSHHQGIAHDSLKTLGRRGFEAFHQLDLNAECARYQAEWTAQKSGTPSPGVK